MLHEFPSPVAERGYSQWRLEYASAMKETDHNALFKRIEVAEAAILTRREALTLSSEDVVEWQQIETALNKLKEAHKAQDVDAIDAATTEMNNAWTAASEELYKATQGDQAGAQQPGGGQQGGGNNNGGGGENVTDAEYEEVK